MTPLGDPAMLMELGGRAAQELMTAQDWAVAIERLRAMMDSVDYLVSPASQKVVAPPT